MRATRRGLWPFSDELRMGSLTVLAVAVLLAARVAGASCAPGTDTDGDGVCDPDDNCVAVANPDQKDTYGSASSPAGAFGDACEPIDAELNVTKVKIRAAAGAITPKGKIIVKGDFVLLAAETFTPPAISARVVDAIEVDQSAPAPSAPAVACTTSSSGRVVRCSQGPQDTVQTVAIFKLSNSAPGADRVVRYRMKITKLTLGGTAFSEPVTVTVTDLGSGIDRVGVIVDCAASNGQLVCREF